MNLRKISLYGSVKERFIQYIYRQSPLVNTAEKRLRMRGAQKRWRGI
jgi:hypothetical protein